MGSGNGGDSALYQFVSYKGDNVLIGDESSEVGGEGGCVRTKV